MLSDIKFQKKKVIGIDKSDTPQQILHFAAQYQPPSMIEC